MKSLVFFILLLICTTNTSFAAGYIKSKNSFDSTLVWSLSVSTSDETFEWQNPVIITSKYAFGYGTLYVYKSNTLFYTYEGNLSFEGKQHGKGTITWYNGRKYEGDFSNGEIKGKGVMTWEQGTRYEGEFSKGLPHGDGICIWASGSKYQGNYKYGQKHGKGNLTWVDGNQYEGDWFEDKKHGKGIFKTYNGSIYYGDFADDLPNGKGILFSNHKEFPTMYIGYFVNFKMHGYGTLFAADGTILKKGYWENNKFIEEK